MFTSDKNPFDPSRFAEMFMGKDMSKMFDLSAMKGFDLSAMKGLDHAALMDAQKKNMDALMAAQQAAAAGYQDLFEKQVAIFQETLSAAQAQIADMANPGTGSDAGSRQAEATRKAYEMAVANITELTELAQKANTDAYEIMRKRIEDSMEELRGLM